MTSNKKRLQGIAQTGICAAALCILAPIAIPAGGVSLSLATLVVLITAGIIGPWKSTAAVLAYLVIGLVGLPVFSGFTSGAGHLFGPNGGYLLGYIPLAMIAGLGRGRALHMICGTIALYIAGTVWYALYTGTPPAAAIMLCVVPYIPLDGVKIWLATIITKRLTMVHHPK